MPNDISQNLTRRAVQRIRGGFIAIAVLVAIILTLRVGHEMSIQRNDDRFLEALSAIDYIETLELKLFKNASDATRSNDPVQNKIRHESVPRIKSAIRRLKAMAPEDAQERFNTALRAIDQTITATHDEIFAASSRNDFETAQAAYQSPIYQSAKASIGVAIRELKLAIQEALTERKQNSTLLANTLTFGFILVGMFLIHRRQKHLLAEDNDHFSHISNNMIQLHDEKTNLESIYREQQQKIAELASVVESTSNLVMLQDAEHRVRWVNNAFCELTGRDSSEVEGRSFVFEAIETPVLSEVLAGADPTGVRKNKETDLSESQTVRFDSLIFTKSGAPLWLSVDRQRLTDSEGETTGYTLVGTDITLKKQQEIQIASYASDMKRFAHIASHDLKEPLRQIWDYLNVLQQADETGDAELKTRCYDVMTKATTRGRNLVSDLLRFAKLQDRKLGKAFRPLEDILEPIVEQLEVSEFPGNVSFTTSTPNILINADDALLQSVIQNLLSNAVKYSAINRPNAVHLGMERDGDVYRLFVTDTGIGFDPEKNESVFEPFTRLVTKKQFAGSGIGLSIVSSIVQKHGWEIKAMGEEGVGASFEIIIPASDVAQISEESDMTDNKDAA